MNINTGRLLVTFDERSNDLDAFTRLFQIVAKGQKWPESQWSTDLLTCLTGKVLSVYGMLLLRDAADYAKDCSPESKHFRFMSDGFREKFNSEKPVGGEKETQYAACMSQYFYRWVELSKTY